MGLRLLIFFFRYKILIKIYQCFKIYENFIQKIINAIIMFFNYFIYEHNLEKMF